MNWSFHYAHTNAIVLLFPCLFSQVCVCVLCVQNPSSVSENTWECLAKSPCQKKANMALEWRRGRIISSGATKQGINKMEDEKRRCAAESLTGYSNIFTLLRICYPVKNIYETLQLYTLQFFNAPPVSERK